MTAQLETAGLEVVDLGRCDYPRALAVQQDLLARVQQDSRAAYLVLAEHDPPVITLGRRARAEHLLAGDEKLAAMGVQVHHVSRGGGVTFHGPGQLVAYPIVHLSPPRRPLRAFVGHLESAVIAALARFGLAGQRREGHTGVFVGEEKIAAIGLAVSRWVSWHGLAVNVGADLSGFDLIVPCGLRGVRPTSLGKLLGRPVAMSEVRQALVECLARELGLSLSAGGSESPCDTSGDAPAPACPPASATARPGRLPAWWKIDLPHGPVAGRVEGTLDRLGLHTVCAAARCPNRCECYSAGVATFLILGDRCTRACRFCAVEHATPLPVDHDEPRRVARAAAELGLRHVVVTSVTRDDLADGGAAHFARTIEAVRRELPAATVEVLTSDLGGSEAAMQTVLSAGPDVFNHNVETVGRLYPQVRPRASYARSLGVLSGAARMARASPRRLLVKSGLMLGLGETRREVLEVLGDLRGGGCQIVTIGQYLAPSPQHYPVARHVPPAQFEELAEIGRMMGFTAVHAGPRVRSSYHARQLAQGVL